jgi:hypothetical protein
MARHDCPHCSCPPPPDQWQKGREVRISDHGNMLAGYLEGPPTLVADGNWEIKVWLPLMHGDAHLTRYVDEYGVDLNRTGNYARVQRTMSEIRAGR